MVPNSGDPPATPFTRHVTLVTPACASSVAVNGVVRPGPTTVSAGTTITVFGVGATVTVVSGSGGDTGPTLVPGASPLQPRVNAIKTRAAVGAPRCVEGCIVFGGRKSNKRA